MFVHTHFHTSFSFLDGYNPIPKAVARVKELGMPAVAVTDHNHIGSWPVFTNECEKQGVRPIYGCEMYYTWSIKEASKDVKERNEDAYQKGLKAGAYTEESFGKLNKSAQKDAIKPYQYDMHQYHLIVLAMDNEGAHNLIKLQSEAADKCTYNGRFLCDDSLLRKYNEGLIIQTACVGSAPSIAVQHGHYEHARRIIENWYGIFGDRLYLEIQPLCLDKQIVTNRFYVDLADKLGIELVATNDVHYTRKEDWDDHDTLLCIGTGSRKAETNRMHYDNEFWIRSEQEMREAFEKQADLMFGSALTKEKSDYLALCQRAIDNTGIIAERCNNPVKLGYDHPIFPNVKVPAPLTAEAYLEQLAWEGLYKYLSKHPECNKDVYEKRLREELDIINPKGFAPYFLTVRDYVTWANANGCPTGPGRGSAAGSLVLFSLGVTKIIDPIKHGLLFFRFLTKDRKESPDVDVDFSWAARDKVIQHFNDYYGQDKVAHIGTYSTMGVKSGLKDVARVLDIPFTTINSITKQIDDIHVEAPQPEFKDYDKLAEGTDTEKEDYKKWQELEQANRELFRLARCFEGSPRQFGIHASGMLITPMPVTDVTPTRFDKKSGVTVTLFTGPQVEEENFVKYDILGLKTVSVIQECLHYIDDRLTMQNLYDEVKLDDKTIYDYISSQETEAVFQLESGMMKGLIRDIQPTEFNDIVAINSLGRPGPLSAGMPKDYAEVKNGQKDIEYAIRGCEDILKETHGVICYQEQLMLISKKVSGFDDMQADSITRKVTAKKKKKLFPMLIRCHIFGKKNCEGPEGWEQDDNAPWYDPKGKYGGEITGALVNGYTVEEMRSYFDKIMGFANYAFNKSHAACYSYISILTAFLKKNYPEEFMAAVLTIFSGDEDKRKAYMSICENHLGIQMATPDINESGEGFTPDAENHRILYGLKSIKSVGDAAIPDLLANRPYASLEDVMNKVPKKAFNKRIGENLIKAGAFDFIDKNRFALLNQFHELRRDKGIDPYDTSTYDKDACIEMEEEVFGKSITYKPWWDAIKDGTSLREIPAEVLNVSERTDKRGGLMAFAELLINKCHVRALIWASKYSKCHAAFDMNLGTNIQVSGKKQAPRKTGEPSTLVVSNALRIITPQAIPA